MDSLKTVQGFYKAGKIISKVVFILSVVAAALCVAGILSLALIPDGVKLGDVTVAGIIQRDAGVSVNTCLAYLAMGIFLAVGEAVLCKFAEKYTGRVLDAGTPFTLEGSKELVRLGILTLAVPAVSSLLGAIAYAIIKSVLPQVAENNWNNTFSLGLGVMLIFAGFVCRYGAELAAKKSAADKSEE